jgi:hypothetical protein
MMDDQHSDSPADWRRRVQLGRASRTPESRDAAGRDITRMLLTGQIYPGKYHP